MRITRLETYDSVSVARFARYALLGRGGGSQMKFEQVSSDHH